MKNIYILLFVILSLMITGCDSSDDTVQDTGVSTEATEKYFGFADKKSVTYEGTQTINDNTAPVSFDVFIEVDELTFSKKTFKVTWKSSIGIPFEEWYEIKDASVYKIAQKYTENSQEKNIIFKNPVLFGTNPLKDGDHLKTETDGETYTYIISNFNYKTLNNDFGSVKRIIAQEGSASNEYYLKENEGFVGFKFNNHPGLYTIEVELKK